MDCTKFEDLLFESLGALLGARDEEAMREHARACARCRNLATLMRADPDSMDVPEDLLSGVVAATSGGSCERAQLLMAQGADGPLGADGGLLSIHIGTCKDCARVARALVQMRHELSTLAERETDDRFVADVLAATTGAADRRPVPWGARFAWMWQRAVQRPRFALEAAYAGVLVVFLLFGLPSRSVTELPVRAFDGLRQRGASVERVVSSEVGGLIDVGRSTWSGSMRRAAMYLDESGGSMRAYSPVERDFRTWATAVRNLAAGVWDRLVVRFADSLRALWQAPPGSDARGDANDKQEGQR